MEGKKEPFDVFWETAGRARKNTETTNTMNFKRISHFLIRRLKDLS